MQSIQDVVEHLEERELAFIAALCCRDKGRTCCSNCFSVKLVGIVLMVELLLVELLAITMMHDSSFLERFNHFGVKL